MKIRTIIDREHYNRNGFPKQAFEDETLAFWECEFKRLTQGIDLHYYQCPTCGKYHTGKKGNQ